MARDVLLVFEAPIATVQLVEQLLAHLETTTGLRTRSRLVGDVTADDVTPDTYPLLLRVSDPQSRRLARDLSRSGVAYGYYLDDNFWLLDPSTEIGAHYAAPAHRRRLDAIVRGAETVIASTPLLQEYVGRLNPHVVQLDSFFDFSLVRELPPQGDGRSTVRGGFAASAQRGQDLEPVLADLLAALDAHPRLEFEVIGVDDGELPSHPRIRRFPYHDSYVDYVAFQRSRHWDFGLAPLSGAASNLYKTDNKFREYAAQGIPGIYQDAPPYRTVRDGETGLLAGTTRSWREAIDIYLGDPGLRSRVRLAARRDAEERCSLDNVAPRWGAVLEAAPPASRAGRGLARLRRRLGRSQTASRRALRRVHLLTLYGIGELRAKGVVSTAVRTARFLRRRILRRDVVE